MNTTETYLPVALDKRIAQARARIANPSPADSDWTVKLLGYLADEAELALAKTRTSPHCDHGVPSRICLLCAAD